MSSVWEKIGQTLNNLYDTKLAKMENPSTAGRKADMMARYILTELMDTLDVFRSGR